MTTRDKPQPTHKRTLSSRLNSLLSPQDPGPSTSRTAQLLDVPNGLGRGANTADMRTPRLGLPSPSSSGLASSAASGAARLPTTSSNGTKQKQQKQKPHLDLSMSIPSQPSSALPSPLKSPLPVLRWSGRPCTTTSTSSSPNGSLSASASPGSSRSGSPLSALHDALNSELPTSPPPSAHVHSIQPPPEVHHQHPQHHHTHPQHPHQPHSQQHDQEQERQQHQQQHNSIPSHFLARSPTYLRTLTLSTLPTSSLSSIPSPSYPYYNDHPPSAGSSSGSGSGAGWGIPEMTVAHSPPTRSSLDTLRSLSLNTSTGTGTSTHMHEPPLRRRHSPSHTNRSQSQSRSQSVDIREFTTSATNAAWKWWAGEGAVGEQEEEKGESERSERLLAEQDRAPTEEEERAKMQRKYLAPKHPIVFCHGLLGFDSVTIGPSIAPLEVTHWRGIKEALEAIGAEVLITRVPATSSPFDRAKVLEQRIEEVYPGHAVHLIGHSMGGLDCRYMTSNLHAHTFSVLSLTTIATPHRGSSFADHFLQTVGKTRFPSVLALLDMLPNGGGDGKAFECLTVEAMRKFNEETPDREGVRYFSWGAVYEPGLIDTWKWPHSVVLEKEGPNDGLVSIQSSKWGTYLGTLEDVNHLDLVGWINTARYKWAEIRGREIKFKPATFYLGCADLLARKVERLGDDEGSGSGSGSGSEGGEGEGEVKELGRKVADEGSEAGEAGKNKERAKANGGKLKVNGSHHLRRDEHDASSSSVQELGRKVAGESSKAAEAEADETRSRARPRAATETEEDITGRGMIFDAGELDSPDSPVDRRRSVKESSS